MLRDIGCIEEMRELLKVLKRCPESCSVVPLIRKNKFNPFVRTTGDPAIQNITTSEKDDFAKFLAK